MCFSIHYLNIVQISYEILKVVTCNSLFLHLAIELFTWLLGALKIHTLRNCMKILVDFFFIALVGKWKNDKFLEIVEFIYLFY